MGKTTTKELLFAILSSQGPTVATPFSDNGAIHIARTILRARPRHKFVILEAGTNAPGWIARSASIARPDVAAIISVGATHTHSFRTLDDTAKEKASLLGGLRRKGTAILNADDPRVTAMRPPRGQRIVRFGMSDAADVRASNVTSAWPERLSFTVASKGITQRVETQLVGVHWTSSALAAISIALSCGVGLADIAKALSKVAPTIARLQPCELPSGAVVLRDDGNGSAQTFDAAFRVLREARATRKVLAITTVGDTPMSWYQRLRKILCDAIGVVDSIVLIGERDDAKRAAKAAISAGFPAEHLHVVGGPFQAAMFLRSFLRAGDLVLLRGQPGDHLARVYFAQTGDVRCWIDRCMKRITCDRCSELYKTEQIADLDASPHPLHHSPSLHN
jgi:UDP-N-acetylmuramoyl-tripeptide--D-alanyl-D-alanine ligase